METEASPSPSLVGVLAWVEVNKKWLLLGAGTAVFLTVAIFLFILHQAQKEQTASQALSDVRLPYSAGSAPPTGASDALLRVANDHRGTKAAARALLLSAGVLFAEGTEKGYAEAQKRFAQVSQDYPDSPWVAEANLGVAASLAALGKTAEATAKYEEIRRRFGSSPIIDDVKLALARLYEPQKPEQAFKLYEELMKDNPNTASAMEAGIRQDNLLKVRPELAKLKEPVVPPVTATTLTNQPIKVTPLTNRAATLLSNVSNRVVTNLQPLLLTNRPATSPPAASNAPPAPAPAPAPPK